MIEDRQDKSILGRIALIVGVLAATATVIGVAWTIFSRENTEVADYQNQVVATCDQVRGILATEHPEILVLDPGGFRVRKNLLLAVMRNNLAQVRIAFDGLDQQAAPDALREQHRAALEAQNAWHASYEQMIATIESRLRANAPLTELQELGVEFSGSQGDLTRLNSTMTALAGRTCHITAASG